jgi:hypothetical protein
VPLKLCQAKLSCGNYAAIEMGAKLLCVPHAAAQDLKKLLHEKTFDQLNHLASSGCGELPVWARFGVPRGPLSGPERRRGRGRPRKWLNANQRWLAWSWRRKGWIVRKVGRPKTERWLGVSRQEQNRIINLEWRRKRRAKKQAAVPIPTFGEFCVEEQKLQRRRGRLGPTS